MMPDSGQHGEILETAAYSAINETVIMSITALIIPVGIEISSDFPT
jgi:hypothetical protein